MYVTEILKSFFAATRWQNLYPISRNHEAIARNVFSIYSAAPSILSRVAVGRGRSVVARGDTRPALADRAVPGNVGLRGSQPGSFPQVTASDLVLRIGKEIVTVSYGC